MVKKITAKALKAQLDAGEAIRVIDVREDYEVAVGALPFAEHIPMNDVPDRMDDIPKTGTVVIMCKVGGRSERVVEFLNSMGYDNLMNLDGGIMRWAAEIDPTIKVV